MKKIFSIAILLLVAVFSKAQFAGDNHEHFKCKSTHLKSAYAPLAHPGLLEYDVKWYNIELEATISSNYINGFSEVMIEAKNEEIDTVFIELSSSLSVDSVFTGSEKSDYTFENDLVAIPLESVLAENQKLSITIYYNGSPSVNNQQDGVFNQNDYYTGKPVTYTLTEPFSAKMWFPCKQVLEDKADSVKVSIITDDSFKVGSNGLLREIVELGDNKVKYVWSSNYPIAYYLVSFALSDYTEYNIYAHPKSAGDSILIQNYVYNVPGYLENNKELIDNTVDMLEYFSEIFTLYPFHEEKYGHAQAAFGGGMEHQTMSTMLDFRFFLVAHELAHQWFGDNVTCATWQDIWVNEGFASYSEYLAMEELLTPIDARNWMDYNNNLALKATDGSIFIPFEEVNDDSRIFSYYLSYKKGASILHMLRFELDDDELFFDILREFQTRYKDSVATGDDFNAVVNELSEKDFDYFFEQWYYGEGFPIYDINWIQEGDSLYIYSKQKSSAAKTQFYKSSLEFVTNYSNGKDTLRFLQDEANETFSVYAPKQITSLNFDPNGWLLKKIAESSNLNKQVLPGNYFDAYPNPVTQLLNVSLNYPGRDNVIELYSVDGKLLYEKTTKNSLETIDLTRLGSGAYFLVVRNTNDRYYSKVLKVE